MPLYLLAIADGYCGRANEAEALLRRVLALAPWAPSGAPDALRRAMVLGALGWLLAHGERFEEARPYYERALAEANDDERPFVEEELGAVSEAMGALEDAEHWYRRALVGLEALGPRVAQSNVGTPRASPYRIRAIESEEGGAPVVDVLLRLGAVAVRAVAGSGGREVVLAGGVHGTLARVLRDEERRDEAVAEQERAVAIVERTRGRGWLLRKLCDDLAR